MGIKSFVTAIAFAGALGASSTASALTLTFFVDVQSSTPGAPAVADFFETWTFTPTASSLGATLIYKGPVTDLASTPQTADLLDLVDLTGGVPFDDAGASTNTTRGTTSFNLRQGINDPPGGVAVEYRHEMSLQSPRLGQFMTSQDDAGLIDFIVTYGGTYIGGVATGGGLTWLEGVQSRNGGTILESRRYDGKAYLNAINGVSLGDPAPVPEPASWALMILGFGTAGAMLRRRTLVRA